MPSGLALRPQKRSMTQWERVSWDFLTKFVKKCFAIGVGDNELSQEFWKTISIALRWYLAQLNPERANFKSSLPKIVRKDFVPRGHLTWNQVNFDFWTSTSQMQDSQGSQLAHGHPGTPVSDLFPLGNSVLGNGNRRSLRPIRAGELRTHSTRTNSGLPPPESSGTSLSSVWFAGTTPDCFPFFMFRLFRLQALSRRRHRSPFLQTQQKTESEAINRYAHFCGWKAEIEGLLACLLAWLHRWSGRKQLVRPNLPLKLLQLTPPVHLAPNPTNHELRKLWGLGNLSSYTRLLRK